MDADRSTGAAGRDDGHVLCLLTEEERDAAFRADVAAGLGATPPFLPAKYAYDARGSELFEEITRQPEYYPTGAERALLAAHAEDLAHLTRAERVVELGSGSSEKTRLVLDALRRAGTLRRYTGVDVSASALGQALDALRADHPGLVLDGAVADVERQLPPLEPGEGPVLAMFLGTTVGNLPLPQRRRFLTGLAERLRPGDHLLVGADLVKDPARILPAYDDAAGVSAEFARNLLAVLRRDLDAVVEPGAWDYRARWDAAGSRVEMALVARRPTAVEVPALGVRAAFAAGEALVTGTSQKFTPDGLAAELDAAGLALAACWTSAPDGDGYALWVGRRR